MKNNDKTEEKRALAQKVMESVPLTLEDVLSEFEKSAKMGVGPQNYVNYECWEWSSDEIAELGVLLKKSREKVALNKKWYANVICEKTGCSYEEAIEKLKKVITKGVSYSDFIRGGKYYLSLGELENCQDILPPKSKTALSESELEDIKHHYGEIIMKEMGWNKARLALNRFRATINCGCTFYEYYIMKLYRKTDIEQKSFVTYEVVIKLYLRYCDYADTWKYFDQKALFNEKFSTYIGRRWCRTDNMSIDDFKHTFKGKKEIIYKPIDALCGIGIKKIRLGRFKRNIAEIFDELKAQEPGVVEEVISQHKEMNRLNPYSINTVRLLTIVKNGEFKVLNALLRMSSSKEQITDNFSAGGICAAIDIDTGIVVTDGVSKWGDIFENHPVTNTPIKGFVIPEWRRIIETCRQASFVVNKMPYIGWDFAIDKKGDIKIIEGNHNPDTAMHQYPWAICEGKGIRSSVEDYLWFNDEKVF